MGKYQAYLQSDHWQATRKEKQKSVRSGRVYLCEECRKYWPSRYMETHHKHYDTKGSEKMDDLQALCIWCHAEKHGKVESIDRDKVLLTMNLGALPDGEMNELRNAFLKKLGSE